LRISSGRKASWRKPPRFAIKEVVAWQRSGKAARVITTDAEIDAAIEQAKLLDDEPLAKTVEHDQRLNVLIIRLTNGRRLVLPVENMQGLEKATHRQLQNYELFGSGSAINFPDIDVPLHVPSLINGQYGNRSWMAALLSAKGGRATRDAKQEAARAKGGRPRKVVETRKVAATKVPAGRRAVKVRSKKVAVGRAG
jgi:hypothetical protein